MNIIFNISSKFEIKKKLTLSLNYSQVLGSILPESFPSLSLLFKIKVFIRVQ
jgi:hypothetical protein